MSKTLQNGSFQDAVGTVVNAGTIEFVLSHDAMIIAGGQVAPTRVTATLDSSGDMPSAFTILANDELTPSGTFYLTTVFDSNGARVFGPERWVFSGASPIDLDTMTPTIVDPAFADPILSNPTAAQAIEDFNLTLPLLNNVRIVDGVKFTTIQAAIDDLTTGASSGTVFVPAGTYSISASLLVNENNMTLVGEGRNNTIIECTNAAVDCVKVTGDKIRMKRLELRYSVAADASTYALRITDSDEGVYEDVYIVDSDVRNGILLEKTTAAAAEVGNNYFNRVRVTDCANDGFTLSGFDGTKRLISTRLSYVVVAGCTGDGLVLNDWVQGVWMDSSTDLTLNDRNLFINPTAIDRTFDIFVDGSTLDDSQIGENLSANNTKRLFVKDTWIATTPAAKFNVLFGSGVTDSKIEGGLVSFGKGGEISNAGDNNQFLNIMHLTAATPPTDAVNITSAASGTHIQGSLFRGNYTNDITDNGTNTVIGPFYTDNHAGASVVGSKLIVGQDTNSFLQFPGSSNPLWNADANDFIQYDRTANRWNFTIGSTVEMRIAADSVTHKTLNPLEGDSSNVPRWIYKQVDHTDMTAAATAATFTLFTLPANTMIHDVIGTVTAAWAGTGPVSAAVASVGTQAGAANDLTLDDNFFAAATVYELHDATASGGKGALLYDATDKFAPHMFVAGGIIELQMDLTGGDHADTSAGAARIYMLVSQPLGNAATEAN